MLALYLITLGVSAGIAGLFGHQLLAEQGFVPVFRAGLYLAVGTAFLYLTIQLTYIVLVRIYKPTRDSAFYFLESLSHLAALVLLPFALRLDVPWPHPAMERFEPLVYLGIFAAIHGVLKLMSFFAAIRGNAAPRRAALVWAACAAACALVAFTALTQWAGVVEGIRPIVSDSAQFRSANGQYARAHAVGEGAMLQSELSPAPGQAITFYWAPDAEATEEDPPRNIHVTIQLLGNGSARRSREFRLRSDGWTAMRLAPDEIPSGVNGCRLVWNAGEAPSWQRLSGLMPVVTSPRRLLLAGPTYSELQQDEKAPNLVILAMDGLGAGRGMPYGRTGRGQPALQRLVAVSVNFPNAYASAPEAPASLMSLLTGVSPLEHGYFGSSEGPLPEGCKTLPERLRDKGYLTAAFTEGDSPEGGDLVFASGFERGFDLFDATGYGSAGPGSAAITIEAAAAQPGGGATVSRPATVDRALQWLQDNEGAKYMLFIRLREAPSEVLEQGRDEKGGPSAWDRSLLALMRHLREQKNTCIIVTAPCGRELASPDASGLSRLTETTVRVPLLFYVPGMRAGERSDIVSLEDVLLTVMRLSSGERDFLAPPAPPEQGEAPKTEPAPEITPLATDAVSVAGDPLALSIRSGKWRLSWTSGISLLAPDTPAPGPGDIILYDVDRIRRGAAPANVALRNRKTAETLRTELEGYLQYHLEKRKAPPPAP